MFIANFCNLSNSHALLLFAYYPSLFHPINQLNKSITQRHFIYFVRVSHIIKRSIVSAYERQPKFSKVVANPKNIPIFTIKVATYPKIYTKIIPKVATNYQIPKQQTFQNVHYTRTQYCLSTTNKSSKMSMTHKRTTQTNILLSMRLSPHQTYNQHFHNVKKPYRRKSYPHQAT